MKIRNQLTILLLFFFGSTLFAQPKISVKSFVKQDNDLTARIDAPKKDQNGDVCAIIKVVTTQTGFTWDSDRLGIVAAIPKTGEYWIYVPFGAKRLTIQHPQLGILRDYQYPLTIEPATVYILELTTGKVEVTVTQETIGSEWVVVTSEPTGADVYIDEKSTGKQTPFSMQYPLGVHSYSLSLDLYHPDAGRFELTPDGGKKKIASTLKPAFGQLKLISSPENGATVVLNGKPMELVTPCTIDKIKSGTYPLTVSKTLYHEKTQTVTIADGQITNVDVVLKPAFGSVSITSSPESGAAVTLDDAPTGQVTPCTLDKIISGNHTVSLRKEWYQPVKKQLVVA
ncbi:MAG: PEGA domain-containing protein, partial [Mariniphaga sp.]